MAHQEGACHSVPWLPLGRAARSFQGTSTGQRWCTISTSRPLDACVMLKKDPHSKRVQSCRESLKECNPAEWGTFFSMTPVNGHSDAPLRDPRCAQHGAQDGLGRSSDGHQVIPRTPTIDGRHTLEDKMRIRFGLGRSSDGHQVTPLWPAFGQPTLLGAGNVARHPSPAGPCFWGWVTRGCWSPYLAGTLIRPTHASNNDPRGMGGTPGGGVPQRPMAATWLCTACVSAGFHSPECVHI